MTQLSLPYGEPWQPRKHHKRGVKFLLEHAAAGLLLDPGAGKTAITLAAFKLLKRQGVARRALVVAPKRVCHLVWPAEALKWTDFHGLKVVVLHGPKKNALLREDADLYCVTPEGLSWLLDVRKVKDGLTGRVKLEPNLATRFTKLGVDTLIVDELTRFKHTSSQRFKTLREVLPRFARRWGLTGSPTANGLIQIYGQAYVLDQGLALGRFVTHFRRSFCVPHPSGFGWQIAAGAAPRIYEKLKPLMMRMDPSDYADLPALTVNDILIELPPEARQVYDALDDDLVAQVRGKLVVAANAGVAMGKCRQVASGGVYTDPAMAALMRLPKTRAAREVIQLHDAKTDALEDLVEELNGAPLLVAYEFQHDLARLRARFGKDVPVLGAATTARQLTALERAWNAGDLPLLLVQPQSAALGLNLQGAAAHVAFYTLPWDYELYDQLIRRVRRSGNPNQRVFVHRLLAHDTVESYAVARALAAKERGQAALFEALLARAKSGCK